MQTQRLKELLDTIPQKTIAVIGDFALDFYFDLKTDTQEISVETGQDVHWASRPRTSLGGAGNVAKNLAKLGARVQAFGLIGEDLFGREMQYLCAELGIKHQGLMPQAAWDTAVYSKPMQAGKEANRLDFGTTAKTWEKEKKALIKHLLEQLPQVDGLILNEQFKFPLLHAEDLAIIEKEAKSLGIPCLADLRSLGRHCHYACLKVNDQEFSRMQGQPLKHGQKEAEDWSKSHAQALLLTLGAQGMLYANAQGESHWQLGRSVSGPIDTVGAGDMVVAAFMAAQLAGANAAEACAIANAAAYITIQQLGETGSASPSQLLALNDL